MNSSALSALVAFANQRPNLQFCNYGNRNTYAQEARSIRQDLLRFNRTLSDAIESGTTDADLLACVDKGGRLTLRAKEQHACPDCGNEHYAEPKPLAVCDRCGSISNPVPLKPACYNVEYCAGQYFPVEYRKAAASLLERANAHARRRTAPTYDQPAATVAEVKRRNRRAGLHFFRG